MARILVSGSFGRGEVSVVVGDLTEEGTDAIVNAANSDLAHGGGVAGAIVRKGGQEIQRESLEKAPVPVGGAVVTGAGRLPCRWVIHAVGPVWGEGDEEAKLRRAIGSALARAEELGLTSLSMPAISTGIFGYPKAEGCRAIAEEVARHLRAQAGSLLEVRLVSIDDETASHFMVALNEL
ncbi:MAG TPA: macro domain-containing protein [Thermoanaerobaculaceae bacterium]|nr:macro domain-containing protein [Thermoanaerobaculaceae bacterium]